MQFFTIKDINRLHQKNGKKKKGKNFATTQKGRKYWTGHNLPLQQIISEDVTTGNDGLKTPYGAVAIST